MCPTPFFEPDESTANIQKEISIIREILATDQSAEEINFYQIVAQKMLLFTENLSHYESDELRSQIESKVRAFLSELEHYAGFDVVQKQAKIQILVDFLLDLNEAKKSMPIGSVIISYLEVVYELVAKAREIMVNKVFAEVEKQDSALAKLASL